VARHEDGDHRRSIPLSPSRVSPSWSGEPAQLSWTAFDKIEVFDPASASFVADNSPSYRRARLWLEATARKTPVSLVDRQLTVSTEALATQLAYQQTAVLQALDADNLRPRILLCNFSLLAALIEGAAFIYLCMCVVKIGSSNSGCRDVQKEQNQVASAGNSTPLRNA
jgi:hypothetical protein